MALVFFNSLHRKKEIFTAPKQRAVRLYTCGPTVYTSLHIGNYRTYIFEDVLKRVLLINGYRVTHVMNITDVGHITSELGGEGADKLAREAARTRRSAWDIARTYETEFKEDLQALHVYPPSHYARATEHITEQVTLIKKLEKRGYTYPTSDGIYFDTSQCKDYGALAPRDLNAALAGKRITMKEKRNATDFALWKFSDPKGPKRDMEWKSPWGVGYPGWHIECSAMAMKYLGETLDIHCGAIDLAETHHPNEIAQSEAATGKLFSRFWLHGAFLTVKGEKMAKSLPESNITITTLRARGYDPLDFRYFVLGTHYRKPLSFSWEALAGAHKSRIKLREIYQALPSRASKHDPKFKKEFMKFADDDLNIPRALALLWTWSRKPVSRQATLWADHVLGLALHRSVPAIPKPIKDLAAKRELLRRKKAWIEADEIRKEVLSRGFRIEDTAAGPVIHKI